MRIRFYSVQLYNFYYGNYDGKQKFSEIILEKFRDKINYILECQNINELSKFRSLNIEKIEKHWSLRIDREFRIEFELEKPDIIIILKISKHYE